MIWQQKYISVDGVTLTCEFSVHHDVQVFLWVGADISGDGVEPNGGILQCETHPGAIEPGQTPEEKKTTLAFMGLVREVIPTMIQMYQFNHSKVQKL